MLTLATELAEREARYGCLGVCVGSGQGVAIVFERACAALDAVRRWCARATSRTTHAPTRIATPTPSPAAAASVRCAATANATGPRTQQKAMAAATNAVKPSRVS